VGDHVRVLLLVLRLRLGAVVVRVLCVCVWIGSTQLETPSCLLRGAVRRLG